ncbi:MAG: hypothetical protein AVDCRST_MAG88-3443, partial [uncultured Thermomicrobiales bacterium]
MSEVSEMNEPWSKPSTGRRGGRRSLAALLLAAGLTLSACGQLSVQVGPPAATAVTLAVPAQPTTAPTAAFATPNESAGSVLIGSLPLATAT